MNTSKSAYFYTSIDGHRYRTYPAWTGPLTKPQLVSVELYDAHRQFIATWFRDDMPAYIVKWYEAEIRYREPDDKRTRR